MYDVVNDNLDKFYKCFSSYKERPRCIYPEYKKPSNEWNWSNGEYQFSGAADYQPLYTNYLFTDATDVLITVKNTSSKYECSVEIYSVEPWYIFDAYVSGIYISAGGEQTWRLTNLDSTKKYYITFGAPCKFSGTIKKIN